MDTSEEEINFLCPYCNENISMAFNQYNGAQQYIEDCEVCCRPIEISYQIEDYRVTQLEIKRLDE